MKQKRTAPYIVTLFTILYGLAIALYVCLKFPAYTAVILLLWLVGWLIKYKLLPEQRHTGSLVLILDCLFTVVFVSVLAYLVNHYAYLSANFIPPTVQKIIDTVMAILYGFVPNVLLNVLFVAGIIYSVLLLSLRIYLINRINNNKLNHPLLTYLFQIGYRHKQGSWLLLPHFLFLKPFSGLFFGLGLLLFVWYFWQGSQPMPILEWVIWFVPFLMILAMDWWIWLSGKVLEPDSLSVLEDDELSYEQSFEELWRKYHQFWQKKWLVAGNKTTGGK